MSVGGPDSTLFLEIPAALFPGVSLVAATTRKPPNCFNFLRQIEILQQAGGPGPEQQFADACHGRVSDQ